MATLCARHSAPPNWQFHLKSEVAYFVAFGLAKANAVRFVNGAPGACKAAIAERAKESAEAQRLSKPFAELGPELGYTQIPSISCGDR